MQTLILAAGYGTRLYPLTQNTPKPLLPIQGKPLIDYLLEKIQSLADLIDGCSSNIQTNQKTTVEILASTVHVSSEKASRKVMVVTNNKFFPHFQNWAGQHRNFKLEIRILNDETDSNERRLGSMGDIDFALKKEAIDEDLLVIGGDNLFDQGLEGFVQTAKKKSPRVTIGLFDLKDEQTARNFGVVSVDQEKKIVSFEEKPQNPKSSLIAMCLYYFPQDSLGLIQKYLNDSKRSDTSGDYIQWLFKREEVYAVTFEGKWYDIGSLEAYEDAQKNFRS